MGQGRGDQVCDKTQLFLSLRDEVNILIGGGGRASTFMEQGGVETGASLNDAEGAQLVPELVAKA